MMLVVPMVIFKSLPILSSPLLRSVKTKALSIVWCPRINWGQTPPNSQLPPPPPPPHQVRATQRQLTTGGGVGLNLSIFLCYDNHFQTEVPNFKTDWTIPDRYVGISETRQPQQPVWRENKYVKRKIETELEMMNVVKHIPCYQDCYQRQHYQLALAKMNVHWWLI